MKRKRFIIGLGVIVVLTSVSLIVLSMKEKRNQKIVVSTESVHRLISEGAYFYDPEQLESDINSSTDHVTLIDLRPPDQYIKDHISEAINIPFQRILDDENAIRFMDDQNIKIIYTNDETKSAEIWVLLAQLGYENVYVLKGGYNYWVSKIEKKDIFGSATKNTEMAKYDFSKEMSAEE